MTATNDFIVGTGAGAVAKKTLAETKTILGINQANETATGVVELATVAEVVAGTDTARAVTPAGVQGAIDNYGAVITKSASAILALIDEDKVVYMTGASAQVITIPTNASVNLPVGTQITFIQYSAQTVTFTPASGVTLVSKDSKRTIDGQYAIATLIQLAGNTWLLVGALKA